MKNDTSEEIGDLVRVAFNLLAANYDYDLEETMKQFVSYIAFAIGDGCDERKYFDHCYASLLEHVKKGREMGDFLCADGFDDRVTEAIEKGKILERRYPRD